MRCFYYVTMLIDKLIAKLEEFQALVTTEGLISPEEYELDQALRATNMNMSIYDPLQVLCDLKTVKSRACELN